MNNSRTGGIPLSITTSKFTVEEAKRPPSTSINTKMRPRINPRKKASVDTSIELLSPYRTMIISAVNNCSREFIYSARVL
jgi:hypothetical protein